jgi:hypothetical protein
MRRLGLLLLALAALGLAACGGDKEKQSAETLPSAPELTVPGESTSATDTTTDTTGTTGTTGTTTTPATTGPSGGATAPPPPAQDTPQNDTPPKDQAPQEFEQFCDQNPGACQ